MKTFRVLTEDEFLNALNLLINEEILAMTSFSGIEICEAKVEEGLRGPIAAYKNSKTYNHYYNLDAFKYFNGWTVCENVAFEVIEYLIKNDL